VSQTDTAHAWWSRLRHQGLLLSPIVLVERYPTAPPSALFPAPDRLRDAHNRYLSKVEETKEGKDRDQGAILGFVDALLENFIGHTGGRIAKQGQFSEKYTVPIRIGSRTETIRPHRIVFSDESGTTPALLVMADTSPHVGRGRGRTKYAQLLELLRGSGHRLGLLTNGQQFRLVYAGLDFESWCEWESDRWFDDGEGTEELLGLRQLLSPDSLKPVKSGVSGLLDAVEESRKRQADLSSVLRENVRQAVELLLEEVSTTNRTNSDLFAALKNHNGDRQLSDAEAHEALLQATVRVVMRLVVCLFAESRQLLPVNDPIFAQSYGVRSLYELLDEVTRYEGSIHALSTRRTAWPRLMALFRLIHGGSSHGAFPLRPYGGVLFRPGDAASSDPVARALHILEHNVTVGDATIYYVLRKLLRGPLPVIKGKSKTFVEGPVDYTDLRTEFIGLIYEGLLDYRLKRTDEQFGPQVFLNIGREPVLPLKRLEDMLANDQKGLKDLLTTLKKEKVTASAEAKDEEEAEENGDQGEEEASGEPVVEADGHIEKVQRGGDYLDAVESAKCWAKDAVVLAGLIRKQGKKESDNQYQLEVEAVANRLIRRVVAVGEFYLVRAGNTRKGTGTFYTRPQLAVPTVHRTLEPLCYDKAEDGTLTPKTPETILGLKVCDPACGSASFLVAALHYLTDALYKSLLQHRQLDDPGQSKRLTLPYGRPRTNGESDQLVPFPPNDPQRGNTFEDRIKALLRRYVVERCIYGVDINSLAVEFARVSLWVETLDPELPFSFLDHKIKVGNSLVGCWLDRVEDYPLKAWEREGGDGKDGPHTQRIEEFIKGKKQGKKRVGDGRIKVEMRQVIESTFSHQVRLFPDAQTTTETVITEARKEYERLHDMPVSDPDQRETYYRDHIERSPSIRTLQAAMDEWCAVWFWPTDENSLYHVPSPRGFHQASPEKDTIVERLAGDVKFFHWEIEYPDVFTPGRSGFDALIGNPPWDVMKPNSQEFFTEFDPLYRTLDKQTALRKQKELFEHMIGVADQWTEYNGRFKSLGNWAKNVAEPFDVALIRGKDGDILAKLWAKHRAEHVCFADKQHPFRLQGSADLNSYKLFAEFFWRLLQFNGRLGIILPTGIYSDFGTKDLREELLLRGRLEFLYAFQNERNIFSSATHSIKQTVIIASKGGSTQAFSTRFRMGVGDSPEAHELPDDILANRDAVMTFTPEDIRQNSPKTLSFVEFKSQRDLDVFRKIYAHSIRIGENATGWEIAYGSEFHMTSDSKLFPPLEKWIKKGYKPDPFGRWIGPEGDMALPLYEGSMIFHFDFAYQGWESGHGASSAWPFIPFDNKSIRPRFLVEPSAVTYEMTKLKVAFRSVARNNLTRTMTAACSLWPSGNSLAILALQGHLLEKTLYLQSLLDSFCCDFVVRSRTAGLNLNWYVIEECPLAQSTEHAKVMGVANRAARLTFIHRRFAPEWLRLKKLCPEFAKRHWKHWWAVTETDRLRLRVELDAICADLYGLNPDDFDWIVRDDLTDPKGFYRVDRQLPFRERLTGLAAAAFRALKEGKWSAESVAALSNDEFFDLLGIPEVTNTDAARAKKLTGPLIEKRDGCHVWKPENFPADDPRHGWTWDHCYEDAVALLGSKEAVQDYVSGKPEQNDESTSDGDGESFQLRNRPQKAKQGKLSL
jgi:hypothetical protein